MSTRIVWNEHEQAVLLQALIDVLNGKTERKEAISEVSKRLRKEAESSGIKIDEKFRNENGISLQMNCLEYAYTGGKSGLHVTRGWYFDIVNKYQNESFKLKGIIKSNINEETSIIDLIFSINLNDLKYFLKEDFYKLKERVKGVISLIYHSLNNHLNVGNEEENNLFHLVCKDNNDNDKNKIYRVILLFPFIEIETEIKERIINFINEIKLVEYIKIKAVFDEEIE